MRRRVIRALFAVTLVVTPAQALAQGATWSTKAPMPTARQGAASAVIDGKLYVVGGQSEVQAAANVLEVYDPITNAWATKAAMPTGRFAPVAGVVGGKLYVIGGYLPNVGCCGAATPVVEVYDPATDSWSTGTPMPTVRHRAAGAVISGKIYIAGGNVPGFAPALSVLEVYDPATNSWASGLAPMPTARFGAGAAALNGLLYVAGGELCGGCGLTAAVEVYNPSTDQWSSAAPMPTALDELTNAVVPFNGRVYVLGGRVSPSGGTTNTVEMYDPVAGTWTAAPSMPTAREQASASGSGNNLYVAGGLGTGAVTAVLEVLSETRTFAYITNQTSNDVAVIDVDATNAFTGGGGLCNPADRPCTLVTRIPVGSDPFGVAVHPAGTFVYVTNVLSGTVSVIDTASNTVVATVPVGATPAGVAINPAGTLVYVVNSDYPVGTISVIDTATNTVTATVTVGANPYGLAVHPAGTSVYVVNDMSNTVSVIDTATKTVTATIPVGARPVSVAFTPSGAFAYVTNGSQSVSVIDTETRTVVHTIPEGAVFFDPYGVAVDPTGAYVYVTNSNSGSLAKIATASNTVVATVPTPGAMNPAGVAVDPSGSHVYVAGVYCNCVLVYDAATLTLTSYVAGMGLAPTAFGQFIGLGSTPTESNTPVGTNIVVTPADTTTGMTPATVTFASVTQAGMTTLTTSSSGPTPPSGFALVGAYYQLASTAVFVAPVRVCIAYNPSGIADETQLKLFHFETSQWVNVTSGSVDNVNHIICGQVSSLSPFAIFKPQAISLTSLGPVTVWVGLKNSDDIGIRFDLRAEVYRNGAQLVGSGEVAGVAGGSSGFNNAKQNVIPLTLNAGTTFASGDTLSVKVLARNACTGSGKNSGTARLWYNDNAADSRFAATIGSPATYYLLSGLGLGGSPGSGPKNTIDVAAGAKCSAYKMFGTWSSTLP